MFSYKKGFWTLLVLVVLSNAWHISNRSTETAKVRSSKVVFITGGTGPFWELAATGAKDAAREFNLELEVNMPEQAEGLEDQMKILATLDPAKLGGIALSPVDAEQQTRLINTLSAETLVLTFDSDAPLSNRLGYVGASNYGAGRQVARLIHEALPEGGKIAVLMANTTKSNLLDRRRGLEDHLNVLLPKEERSELAEYEVVDFLVDNGDNEKCAELIRHTLSNHDDLGCFVALNARHAPILLNVLGEQDQLGKIKLVTFDYDEAILAAIESGQIYATIAQDPYNYGYESVQILASHIRGDLEGGGVVGRGNWIVPTQPIRKEDVEQFRAKLNPSPAEDAKESA